MFILLIIQTTKTYYYENKLKKSEILQKREEERINRNNNLALCEKHNIKICDLFVKVESCDLFRISNLELENERRIFVLENRYDEPDENGNDSKSS